MRRRLTAFCRREPVLLISGAAALLSMLLTPPSAAYGGYIDWNVLMLLFSLMAVVAGLRASGLWLRGSQALLRRAGNTRAIALLLTAICFFAAMLVTNDVALITFVPLGLSVLTQADAAQATVVVVLMTMAANLGSMTTPVGNPQNLFLYSAYKIPLRAFLGVVAPCAAVSAALLAVGCLVLPNKAIRPPKQKCTPLDKRRLWIHGLLFGVCLLAVLDALPVWAVFAIVLAVIALLDRKALAEVDYSLLLTFVFFFVLAGNLAGNEGIREAIARRMEGHELLFSAGVSQCISNVPAAVLLSSFTENWKPLLLGVDIGGLGTPVASLASLISYRLYSRSDNARPGLFMRKFLLWNFGLLCVLLLITQFLF